MNEAQPLASKIVGGIIIFMGLYLLLGIIVQVPMFSTLVNYWPLTLVLLGATMLFGGKERSGMGAIIMLVGMLAVGSRLGLMDSDTGQAINDIILLSIGLLVLVGFASPKEATTKKQ